jgi:hypothetical protein
MTTAGVAEMPERAHRQQGKSLTTRGDSRE